MPAAFTWTNRNSLSTVNRAQPLPLSWSGVAANNTVLVAGLAVDIPNSATSGFICTAHPTDTSFTVPPIVLANLPAQHTRASQSLGVIYIGEMPLSSPTTFSAGSVSSGTLMPAQVLGKSVAFQ
jgi:hypothetical protein